MSKDIYQIIKDLDKVTNPVRITKKTLQESINEVEGSKKLNQVDKSYAPSDRLNPEIIKRIMWDHGITFSTEEVSVLLARKYQTTIIIATIITPTITIVLLDLFSFSTPLEI